MDCGKIVVHLCIVHRSGIFFVALVAKSRVASQYHFNEKPHTITNDMIPPRVIMVIFVLLATGNITFGGMALKWQK